ncbi:MAG: glycosyltransferase [Fimbriimonas sp.]|nr:glycosyltransferase [Fimbriimonas sp.]
MRLFVLLQRYLVPSESWLTDSIGRMSDEVVGIAGRTIADPERYRALQSESRFFRLRSRNLIHRVLPMPLRRVSPWRGDAILARAIAETRADRVLCHFGVMAAEYEAVWNETDIPLFVHFHGYDAMFDMREHSNPDRPVHEPGYRDKIVRLSERAIYLVNSQFLGRRLTEAGVHPDRIVVKPLGVKIATEPKKHTQSVRPQISTIGRLVDCKGVDKTVEAFALMRSRGVEASLVIVGEGPERGRIERAIQASGYSGDIRMTGWLSSPDLQRVRAESDIYTVHNLEGPLTRQVEAYNLSIVEAMAGGLPVAVTRSGGAAESVVEGITGFLSDPGDINEQADNLEALVRDGQLRQTMGLAGWKRAQQVYTVEYEMATLRRVLNMPKTK